MSKSSGTKTATSTATTELPSWVNNGAQDNFGLATQIAAQPLVQYGGDRTADFNADQTNMMQGVRNLQGTGAASMAGAINTANGVAGYDPRMVSAQNFLQGNVNAYMNPYLQNVEAGALDSLDRSRLQSLNRTGDQAASAGAFGGSRHGVMEGVLNSESARQAGDLSNNIRSQAFNAASGLMTGDMNRDLQAQGLNQTALENGAKIGLSAAQLQGQLAGQQRTLTAQELAMLEASGKTQQQMTQADLDQGYQNYVQQASYPTDMLNIRLSALGMSPYGKTNTSTTPVQQSSPMLSALGGASTGASIASSLGLSGGWGAAATGVGGLLGAFA